jgi:hypothetical protein
MKMKKSILFLSVLLVSVYSFAQSEKYIAAMKNNITAIDTSFKNPQNLLGLANNFERIALAEKNQWLPYYYAAYCQVNFTYMEQDKSKIDAIADKATWLINKADSLQPANSEISCIKSMIASCRMMVNPMQRYMEFGPVSALQLENAIQQDPSNPRPYFLKGQGLKYTPEQFGGGCKTAIEQLQTAMDKFAAFKPASEISPNWGMKRTEMILNECK